MGQAGQDDSEVIQQSESMPHLTSDTSHLPQERNCHIHCTCIYRAKARKEQNQTAEDWTNVICFFFPVFKCIIFYFCSKIAFLHFNYDCTALKHRTVYTINLNDDSIWWNHTKSYQELVTDLVWFWYFEMVGPPSLEKKERKERHNKTKGSHFTWNRAFHNLKRQHVDL